MLCSNYKIETFFFHFIYLDCPKNSRKVKLCGRCKKAVSKDKQKSEQNHMILGRCHFKFLKIGMQTMWLFWRLQDIDRIIFRTSLTTSKNKTVWFCFLTYLAATMNLLLQFLCRYWLFSFSQYSYSLFKMKFVDAHLICL